MRCCNCGGNRFVRREYRSGKLSAPAAECERCRILALVPGLAETEAERDSVRMAIAARATLAFDVGEAPTLPCPPSAA